MSTKAFIDAIKEVSDWIKSDSKSLKLVYGYLVVSGIVLGVGAFGSMLSNSIYPIKVLTGILIFAWSRISLIILIYFSVRRTSWLAALCPMYYYCLSGLMPSPALGPIIQVIGMHLFLVVFFLYKKFGFFDFSKMEEEEREREREEELNSIDLESGNKRKYESLSTLQDSPNWKLLSPREKSVLELRLGLDVFDDKVRTVREAASELGISEKLVLKIETAAKSKLEMEE